MGTRALPRPFKTYKDRSFWRRIAMATWKHSKDPQIYAAMDVDARGLLRVLEEARAAGGVKLTPTHFVGKAAALGIAVHPEVNGIIVRGKLRVRKTVDVWFNVVLDDGDLFGAKVVDVPNKSTADVARELAAGAAKIRRKSDDRMQSYARITRIVPPWLLGMLLSFVDVLNFRLGLNLAWAGVERDPFGSVMVTSIATFDLDLTSAHPPLPPLMRLPALVVVSRIVDKPVAEDGRVVVRPVLPLFFTVDHRYMDGFQAARMIAVFRDFLENEERLRASVGEISHARE